MIRKSMRMEVLVGDLSNVGEMAQYDVRPLFFWSQLTIVCWKPHAGRGYNTVA